MRGRVVCYISDIEHSDPWPDPLLAEFVHDADLVIYDGMFSETEYTALQRLGPFHLAEGGRAGQAAGRRRRWRSFISSRATTTPISGRRGRDAGVMPTAFIARERQAIGFEPIEAKETVADPIDAAKVPAG